MVHLNINGKHNVRNALFAILCADLTGADIPSAVNALEEYRDMKGRGQTVDNGRYIIINDAYNAAPESMEAAFFNLDVTGRDHRKIAVLGGMLELGDWAGRLHEEIGRDCGRYGFDKIFVTGDNREDFVRGLLESDKNADYEYCGDTEEVKEKLSQFIKEGDCILFKASNAFGFESLAAHFAAEGDAG
jgi:UDP-N-acetylmuramyl pentapeptide synthase